MLKHIFTLKGGLSNMAAPQLTIVGLGSGDPHQLTLCVWRRLQAANRIFVRTAQHPAMSMLQDNGIAYTSFDTLYEQFESFPDVYKAIAEALIAEANNTCDDESLIYAVPGHPMVAERTV